MELGRLTLDESDGEVRVSVRPSRNLTLTLFAAVWLMFAAVISFAGTGVLIAGGFGWATIGVVVLCLTAFLSFGIYALVWNLALHGEIIVTRETIRTSWNALGLTRVKELPIARVKEISTRPIWPYSSNDVDYEFLGRGLWHVEVVLDRGREKLLRRVTREQATLIVSALESKGFNAAVAQLRMGELRGRRSISRDR